jgi:hypothetical protein
VPGRQGGKYKKFKLIEFNIFNFGLDTYVLKYEPLAYLKPHTDKVLGKHLRLNIQLTGEGKFDCKKTLIKTKNICLFRPDKYMHALTNGNTERKVLSIGVKI